MKKNIFITGGAGYVGSVLVPKLLNLSFNVTVYDLMMYGTNVIETHPNLTKINKHIQRNEGKKKSYELSESNVE